VIATLDVTDAIRGLFSLISKAADAIGVTPFTLYFAIVVGVPILAKIAEQAAAKKNAERSRAIPPPLPRRTTPPPLPRP
jgi:spore coat polysaccharide biosynthesis predicted glycosyltransferase SpsG